MNQDKADNLIKRVRTAGLALMINSVVMISVSFFISQGVARKADTDLNQMITIQSQWPKKMPRHFATLVSDITLGSDKYIGYMGYVGVHSSSPYVEKYPTSEVFLSSDNNNLHIYDASYYQESVLEDLQLTFSSAPGTLKEYQESWDKLAFPMYFIQFGSLNQWYLGTPDENNIVWWDSISTDSYVPEIPSGTEPQSAITMELTNKDSKWSIMGNIWRGEDSSSEMKEDLDSSDGWFLYKKYEINGRQHHLVATLGKPVLKKILPLKYIPGHDYDDEIVPFALAFPWITEYGKDYGRISVQQIRQFIKTKEQTEGKELSLFGFSTTQRNIILFGIPSLLVFLTYTMATYFDFYRNLRATKEEVLFTEPWLLLSSSKIVVLFHYLYTIGLPVLASVVTAFALVSINGIPITVSVVGAIAIITLSSFLFILSKRIRAVVIQYHKVNNV